MRRNCEIWNRKIARRSKRSPGGTGRASGNRSAKTEIAVEFAVFPVFTPCSTFFPHVRGSCFDTIKWTTGIRDLQSPSLAWYFTSCHWTVFLQKCLIGVPVSRVLGLNFQLYSPISIMELVSGAVPHSGRPKIKKAWARRERSVCQMAFAKISTIAGPVDAGRDSTPRLDH